EVDRGTGRLGRHGGRCGDDADRNLTPLDLWAKGRAGRLDRDVLRGEVLPVLHAVLVAKEHVVGPGAAADSGEEQTDLALVLGLEQVIPGLWRRQAVQGGG